MLSEKSLVLPVQSKNPREVWDVFCVGWLGASGLSKCIHTDEGGEWGNEVWADLCAGRQIKLQFQGVGAHPWSLERRTGFARGISNRLIGDDRSAR